MADRLNVEVRKQDGKYVGVQCPDNVVQHLQDTLTDASVKSTIHDLLVVHDPSTHDSQAAKRSTWDSRSEKLVVDHFKKVNSSNFPKSARWKTIADKINRHGYNFTPEQCRLKIKTVKERCERTKNRGNVAGTSQDISTSVISLEEPGICDAIETFPEDGQILTSNPEALVPAEHSYSTPPVEMIRVAPPKSTWTEHTEKLVMEQLKVVVPGKYNRTKWSTIAENINSHGHHFTNEQVRLKVKALKEKYIRLRKRRMTSPIDPPDDSLPYLKDVFSYLDTSIESDSVITTDSGPPTSVPNNTTQNQCVQTDLQKTIEARPCPDGPSSAKRRRTVRENQNVVPSCDQLTNILEMKVYLESLFERREAAVEKRHQEKMALLRSLLDVLKHSVVNSKSTDNNRDVGLGSSSDKPG